MVAEKAYLRSTEQLATANVTIHLSSIVTGLGVDARIITLETGDLDDYDGQIIATGVTARELPFGHNLRGVHVLRTLDDTLAPRTRMKKAARVAVIGLASRR